MKRISALLLLLVTIGAGAQTITRKAVYKKGQGFLPVAIKMVSSLLVTPKVN
jgi:hypothetical protein